MYWQQLFHSQQHLANRSPERLYPHKPAILQSESLDQEDPIPPYLPRVPVHTSPESVGCISYECKCMNDPVISIVFACVRTSFTAAATDKSRGLTILSSRSLAIFHRGALQMTPRLAFRIVPSSNTTPVHLGRLFSSSSTNRETLEFNLSSPGPTESRSISSPLTKALTKESIPPLG
eukprot:CCRYP_018389-RC/>CCRYP_018389-RC protein AED:0.45 eAED:0.45 QI:0/0/0/1/0/0/2/0/176